MPKMTIYVPDDLQEGIDTLDMCANVKPNWSSVAQEAFRREIELWNARINLAPKIRDAVDRLRRSKEMSENKSKSAGDLAGRKWAAEKAEYLELVRLKEFVERSSSRSQPMGRGEVKKVWPVWEAIAGASRTDDYDPEWCVDFWSEFTSNANDLFVDAFVDGALAVFAEVEPQL